MKQVIRNVRLRGHDGTFDVAIDGERIEAVEPSYDGSAEKEYEGEGNLLVPGLVNAHQHLDKSRLGDVMRPNESNTFMEAIHITNEHKRSYTVEEIADRAASVIETAIINGTTAMRGFADVDTTGGLIPVEALLELKRRFAGRITLEVVAFPQEGLTRDPGADRLMEQAMELGADIVGGLPWYEHLDKYVHDHVDFCFELGHKTGKDIHMLVDNTDSPNSRALEYLAVRTVEEGYEGRVTASHCESLGAYEDNHADKVIALVKEAEISISSNTQISLALTGHRDRGLIRRGITRVNELVDAGVNVLASQDDVNDPYYAFGKPDQLEVGQYMAHTARLTYPAQMETVFDMIGPNAAKAMRLEGYGIEPGARADLVLIDAPTVHAALRLIPPRSLVFYGGKLVAESKLESILHD